MVARVDTVPYVHPVARRTTSLLAPVALLGLAVGLTAYGASCAAAPGPTSLPELNKIVPTLPEPDPIPVVEPPAEPGPFSGTVAEALDVGCTTTIIKGLSEQIIAEGNCMFPGSYAKLPALDNVTLDDAVFPYLRLGARDALVDALEAEPKRKMKINSMLRTVAQQYLLHDWYKRGRCGVKLAALPGKSNHQTGLAIDISKPGSWRRTLKRHGYRWFGKRDQWHFDYVDGDAHAPKGLDVEAFQRLWNRNHPDEPIGSDGDWGDATKEAMRRAPAGGFPKGARCEVKDVAPPDASAD